MTTCILLKDRREQDPYLHFLQEEGSFDAASLHCLPVLGHELREGDKLRDALLYGEYSGLIITSQRAVEAWHTASEASNLEQATATPKTRWSQTPHYVVGPATSHALCSSGSWAAPSENYVLGASSGNGQELATFIIHNHHPVDCSPSRDRLPLLYLTGDKRQDTIVQALQSASLPFHELCVYETAVRPSFAQDLNNLLDELSQTQQSLWMALFSPSGADAALEVIRRRSRGMDGISLAALGPTTAQHLRCVHKLEPDAVAAAPKPHLLAQAISAAMP